ncbi:MAG: tRNA 5-methoxyuridine(34)/uridine 5-oxyacetic acid(34) synthase CmoB [Xanthomonadales bacterium]|nr:tRNA 5-methoxyuridine(34)/uridine 5-oxyacetic acid(34) synthase CmoB [Xanthomonadales bacterium]
MQAKYARLNRHWPDNRWLERICDLATMRMQAHPHGDLPRWRAVVDSLPRVQTSADLTLAAPRLGTALAAGSPRQQALSAGLMALHPWRKGPLCLAGLRIDSEWRSDWKWDRVAPHIALEGRRVLDIGCGNGYFGLRMLGSGARLVIGIDPTLLFVMQWQACRHFAGDLAMEVLPLGVEDLPAEPAGLDTVFSMGVLYHRRNPVGHLKRIHDLLRAGGEAAIETLVLPMGSERAVLVPDGRYARMRNVWAIPGSGLLLDWVRQAGFSDARLADLTPTTPAEQRSTRWMRFQSLDRALDPQDARRTVEGHPAPIRALVIARR